MITIDSAKVVGFEQIYTTDLVFTPGCWELCGDAHCCSFARYKSRFKMIARTPFQELPLLPGEYEFLSSRGWLKQFGDYEHKVVEFEIDGYTLRAESLLSRRPNCACDHGTRTTICRLYPLLPVFDVNGRIIGTESTGIYEDMERIAGLDTACKVTSLPFDQLNHFLTIAKELGKSPVRLFYMEAYRITKRHVSEQLAARCEIPEHDIFSVFEAGFIRRNLIDKRILRSLLSQLAEQFEKTYGDRFVSEMKSN